SKDELPIGLQEQEFRLDLEEAAMSVTGISSLLGYIAPSSQSNNMQQFQQEFQQLGQDLQSGNLSAAQSDFVTLQQYGPQSNSASASQSNDPIAQAFSQLSQALQSGNLSAAQQDYSTIQSDFQNALPQGHRHHHHGGGRNGSGANGVSQLMNQLGQALQSGNLSTAQQAYSALQQDFQQFGENSGTQTQASSPSGSNGVSVNA
ncbi:MAG: hypothetical protein WCA98_06190, partial [Candidatus Acidiferrales bacterium]